jgi:hypothetical protein
VNVCVCVYVCVRESVSLGRLLKGQERERERLGACVCLCVCLYIHTCVIYICCMHIDVGIYIHEINYLR